MTGGAAWAQAAAVACGAAVGALLRWRVGVWLATPALGFPAGTLVVNCIGGLLVGVAVAYLDRMPDEFVRLLLVTGFLGGLTTFSSFSAESLALLQRGDLLPAAGHTLAHVVGSLACAAVGHQAAEWFLG